MVAFDRDDLQYDPKKGAVIYNRGKNSKHKMWKDIYNKGVESYRSIKPLDKSADQLSKIKDFFLNASEYERQRETTILSTIFKKLPKSIKEEDKYIKYIHYINKNMGFGSIYKKILKGLQQDIEALEKNKKDGTENKGRMKSVITHSFIDYLVKYLAKQEVRNKVINSFLKIVDINKILDGSLDKDIEEAYKEILQDVVNDGIKEAWNVMMKAKISTGSNEKEPYWYELYDKYVKNFGEEQIIKDVKDVVVQYIQFDELGKTYVKLFKKNRNRFIKHSGGSGNTAIDKVVIPSTNINGVVTSEGVKHQIGGALGEIVSSYLGSNVNSSLKVKGHTAKSNMAKTDNIFLLSKTVELDLEKIATDFETYMHKINDKGEVVNLSSLKEAAEQHEKFYTDVIGPIEDLYIIYESTKMYTLGKSFEGVSSGTQKVAALLERADLLSKVGINPNSAKEVIGKFYNTIPGAIGENDYKENRADISFMVAATAASFLFDDWKTIGSNKGKGMHIFNIDNVYIPLSYVLKIMGDTIDTLIKENEQAHFIRMNITGKPKSILYPNVIPITAEQLEKANGSKANLILAYWQEQFDKAESQFKFNFKFLRNFKQIVSDQLSI